MADVACAHPIRVDLRIGISGHELGLHALSRTASIRRECAFCGFGYDRGPLLSALALQCFKAWAVDFGRVSQAIRDEGDWRGEEFVP